MPEAAPTTTSDASIDAGGIGKRDTTSSIGRLRRLPGLASLIGVALGLFVAVVAASTGFILHELDSVNEVANRTRTETLPMSEATQRQALELAYLVGALHRLSQATSTDERERVLRDLDHRAMTLGTQLPGGLQQSLASVIGQGQRIGELRMQRERLDEQVLQQQAKAREGLSALRSALLAAAPSAAPDSLLAALELDLRLEHLLVSPAPTERGGDLTLRYNQILAELQSALARLAERGWTEAGAFDAFVAVELPALAEVFDLRDRVTELRRIEQDRLDKANATLQSLAARFTESAVAMTQSGIASLNHNADRSRLVAWTALGVLLLFSLLLAWSGQRWLLKPLRDIDRALQALRRGRTELHLQPAPVRELAAVGLAIRSFGRTLGEHLALNRRLKSEIEQRRDSEKRAIQAQSQTRAAIESINDGFLLFDAGNHLVLSNDTFLNLYPISRHHLQPGATLQDILTEIRDRGLLSGVDPGDDEWLQTELLHHRILQPIAERRLAGGRWISLQHFRTSDGGLVCLHADITHRKRAEHALERRSQIMQLMRELALLTSEAESIDQAMRLCLERIGRFGNFVLGNVWMPDKSNKVLRPRGVHYTLRGDQRLSAFIAASAETSCALGVDLPGRCWSCAEATWINDVSTEPDLPRAEAARQAGLRAGFAVPILGQGQAMAVLEFYARRVLQPDRALLESLTSLSAQLGRLIERKRNAEQVRKLFRAVDQSPAIVLMTDNRGRIEYVNPRFTQITGYTLAEAAGRTPSMLKSGSTPDSVYRKLWASVSKGQDWRGELHNRKKSGELYWTDTTISPVRNDSGDITHFIGIAEDITERKQSAQRIEHLAFYDSLTNLPNRALFLSHLRQELARGRRDEQRIALVLVDLDNFKDVNDSLGHNVGDELLQRVANRLQAALRECDLLARLGGDEFGLLMELGVDSTPAANVARRTIDALAKPFVIDQQEIFIAASVGISTYPEDGQDQNQLLKNAELALYRGKDKGKGQYHFYAPELDASVRNRKLLEGELRNAISGNQFRLWYQPQVDATTRLITGAEALIRWVHPDRGLVSPAEFIPVAEQSGLILQIGAWALNSACRQIAVWNQLQLPEVEVAVNLSAVQFQHQDLVATVREAIDGARINPAQLTLEITESVVMQEGDGNVRVLEALRALGVRVSLDDFGTGYSSLSYLSRFPIDKIKIDRSFVREVLNDPLHQAVIDAVVKMGRVLNVKVNVEGVETQEQFDLLQARHIDEVQGFYFSKPVPAEEFAELLLLNQMAKNQALARG